MDTEMSELLLNALNEQGYLFQEACFNELKQHVGQTHWKVEAYEYGVSSGEQDTKVDIVLHYTESRNPELYAVVECKRAAPSYVYWLFTVRGFEKGPRQAVCLTLNLQCPVVSQVEPYRIKRLVTPLEFGIDTFNAIHCMEVNKAREGRNRRTSNPQTIESAFTQVLKGVGGLAQEQERQRGKSLIQRSSRSW